MSIVQWLLLFLVIVVVAGAYWYLRRHAGSDPWQGMDEEPADDDALARGEALGGDSYIVGVRTLTQDTPGDRNAANGGSEPAPTDPAPASEQMSDAAADASWRAYKQRGSEQPSAAAPSEPAPRRAAPTAAAPDAAPVEPTVDRVDNIRPQRAPADGEQQVFVLHVASPDGRVFDGPDVHTALQGQELKFGLNDIYHRVTETNGVAESVFAVANMLKPGTLDPVDQDHLATPGLTFFLVLPGPIEGAPALRDMMETANVIAKTLGGDVLDDKRALLKAQTAQYMIDEIADFDRRARIAKRR